MQESSFQFQNPRLRDFELHICNSYDATKAPQFKNRFDTHITKFDNDPLKAIVELEIIIGDDGSENNPYTIHMTVGSMFEWREVFDEDTTNQLLSINAPALLLSYARPVIAMMTTSAGPITYTIPFFNFTLKN